MPLVPSRRSSSTITSAVVDQCNQAVKPQVSDLTDQPGFQLGFDLDTIAAVVQVLGGHHGLGGFFADFFQEGVGALVQQPRHIALAGVAAMSRLAAFNDLRQALESVVGGHVGFSADYL
jgi:hypothetical protein